MLARATGFRYAVRMLSVVIETDQNADALAATLASLVGAAVDGVVREVIVCDAGACSHTELVADHAGCLYLPKNRAAHGIRRAKSEWILLLEPGARLADGWIDGVIALTGAGKQAARFTCARQSRPSWLEKLQQGRRPLRDGLVIPKEAALLTGKETAADIARASHKRRLHGEILAAPR